jgi:hypothetical protein
MTKPSPIKENSNMSFDGALEKLISFDAQSYKEIFKNHVEKTIIGIDKYNVPPVYSLQFALNRFNYQPQPVLMSVDDNVALIKGHSDSFESLIRDNRTDYVPPTVIIAPQNISIRSLILGETNRPPIIYTPFYLLIGSEFKQKIVDDSIGSLHVYSNKQRDKFVVRLGDAANEPLSDAAFASIALMNTAIAYPLKLPFINFVNGVNQNYREIVNAINLNIKYSFDKDRCGEVWKDIQDNGIYTLINDDPIFIYKDFVKQKPNHMDVYYAKNTIGENEEKREVMNICLDMYFDTSKLHHIVIYRYLIL